MPKSRRDTCIEPGCTRPPHVRVVSGRERPEVWCHDHYREHVRRRRYQQKHGDGICSIIGCGEFAQKGSTWCPQHAAAFRSLGRNGNGHDPEPVRAPGYLQPLMIAPEPVDAPDVVATPDCDDPLPFDPLPAVRRIRIRVIVEECAG